MRLSRSSLLIGLALTAAVAALLWTIASDRRSRPYTIERRQLTGWAVVPGEGGDPWVLALQPPEALAADLFAQLAGKSDAPFERIAHTALPLVLRGEYEEGLQGVYGTETLAQIARDDGMARATLTPICVARRVDADRGAEIVFVVFDSPEFRQMRGDFIPAFPEHAGTGIYDPATLTALLPLAERGGDFRDWWPLAVDPRTDCQAPVTTR